VVGVLYYFPGLKGLCPAVLFMLLMAEALVRARLGVRIGSPRPQRRRPPAAAPQQEKVEPDAPPDRPR
jgi:hypothetical protein